MVKRGFIILYLLSVQLFLTTVTAYAKPQIETLFNTPGFTGQGTTTIEDKLIEMLKSSLPGSKVRIALYTLDRVPLVHELVYASQRGVDVQIVFDGGNVTRAKQEGHALHMLLHGFNGNSGLECANGEDDCIKFCSGPLAPLLKPFKIR